MSFELDKIQAELQSQGLDGWLFYDFHGRDPIAYRVLGLQAEMVTRRWYYFVPAQGTPQKLVHRIEANRLDKLPGQKHEYVAWSEGRNRAYMQTPLVYGDFVYSCRNNGGLNCYRARTGEVMYRERLGSGQTGFTASPVAADGKLYFKNDSGTELNLTVGGTGSTIEEFSSANWTTRRRIVRARGGLPGLRLQE